MKHLAWQIDWTRPAFLIQTHAAPLVPIPLEKERPQQHQLRGKGLQLRTRHVHGRDCPDSSAVVETSLGSGPLKSYQNRDSNAEAVPGLPQTGLVFRSENDLRNRWSRHKRFARTRFPKLYVPEGVGLNRFPAM